MRAAKRLQMNSQLSDGARPHLEPRINASLIIPIFWCEEASQIAPAEAAAFRNHVYWALKLERGARLGLWAAAAAALAGAVAAMAALAVVAARRQQACRGGGGEGGGGGPEGGAGEEGRVDEEWVGGGPAEGVEEGVEEGGPGGAGAEGSGDDGGIRAPLLQPAPVSGKAGWSGAAS